MEGVIGLHHTDAELDEAMGLFVLVDEKEVILEQRFEADDRDWFARFLSRWARDLLKMAAEQDAGDPLFGGALNLEAGEAVRTYGPLRAQIFIPDERGVQAEWRFETTDVAELADWLVALGKWHRRPTTADAPPGLVGPDSESEPDIFVWCREARVRFEAFAEELRATAPARGRRRGRAPRPQKKAS